MEEKGGLSFIFLIIISLWFWHDHNALTNRINDLEDENNTIQEALDQANTNIDDARSYAWSSYDDMGDALENLETVNP